MAQVQAAILLSKSSRTPSQGFPWLIRLEQMDHVARFSQADRAFLIRARWRMDPRWFFSSDLHEPFIIRIVCSTCGAGCWPFRKPDNET